MEKVKSRSEGLKTRGARYVASFSFVGLVFGALFFCASATPSLFAWHIPRSRVAIGVCSGSRILRWHRVGGRLLVSGVPISGGAIAAEGQAGDCGCGI